MLPWLFLLRSNHIGGNYKWSLYASPPFIFLWKSSPHHHHPHYSLWLLLELTPPCQPHHLPQLFLKGAKHSANTRLQLMHDHLSMFDKMLLPNNLIPQILTHWKPCTPWLCPHANKIFFPAPHTILLSHNDNKMPRKRVRKGSHLVQAQNMGKTFSCIN